MNCCRKTSQDVQIPSQVEKTIEATKLQDPKFSWVELTERDKWTKQCEKYQQAKDSILKEFQKIKNKVDLKREKKTIVFQSYNSIPCRFYR